MKNKQVRVWIRVRVTNNVLIGEKQTDVNAIMIFLMLTYINFNLAFISSFVTFFSVAFFHGYFSVAFFPWLFSPGFHFIWETTHQWVVSGIAL